MRRLDARLLVLALALVASACASSDGTRSPRVRDGYELSRPSNSPVLYPGEYRSQYEWQLWRLPQF